MIKDIYLELKNDYALLLCTIVQFTWVGNAAVTYHKHNDWHLTFMVVAPLLYWLAYVSLLACTKARNRAADSLIETLTKHNSQLMEAIDPKAYAELQKFRQTLNPPTEKTL
jgi:hypothetical protein